MASSLKVERSQTMQEDWILQSVLISAVVHFYKLDIQLEQCSHVISNKKDVVIHMPGVHKLLATANEHCQVTTVHTIYRFQTCPNIVRNKSINPCKLHVVIRLHQKDNHFCCIICFKYFKTFFLVFKLLMSRFIDSNRLSICKIMCANVMRSDLVKFQNNII